MKLTLAPGTGFEVRTVADLDTYLGAVAEAGFDGVSLGLQQLPDDLVGAGRLLATHGLGCTDLISLRVTRNEDETLAAARALRPVVEALGAGHVLTMLWTRPSEESFDRLGRCADAVGVPLALEFGPAPCPTMAAAVEVVDAVGPSRIGVLADTFHHFRNGGTQAMLDEIPLERLPIVQVTDALPPISDDYMDETTNRRTWPGLGELDLDGFASTLRTRGWDGIVSVEVLSTELRRLPVEAFARQAYETSAPTWR